MPVARALSRRLAVFVASLLVASVVVFGLINLLPGDVAGVILGSSAKPGDIDALRQQMGLNVAAPLRYLHWIGGLLHGDFGLSAISATPIGPMLASTLGVTFSLVILGMIVAVALALPLGAFAAMRRRRVSGTVVSALSQIGMSVPAFLAGWALVMLFAVKLHWLPANGYTKLTQDPLDWLRRLILPVLALGIIQAAVLVRYVRGAFVDVLSQDYFRTARSVGWTSRRALLRHGVRNAALQIATVIGLQLGTLLVGAVVIENVFALPGMGALLLASVSTHDLPVVQAIVMVLVAFILAINAIVDMAYAAIDPRLRSGDATDDEGAEA